ncbi:MAG TPA: GyrI-like domain-containing protein [Anaerolineae bacterium]
MPEIKQFPKTRVAYLEIVGPYGTATVQGFDDLFKWLDASGVQPMGAPIGIYYDDPAKTAPEKMRADMCVPVALNVQGTGKVKVKDIGGIEVATILYQGEPNIQPAYDQVYQWLRAQGYHESGAPIETYFSHPPEEMRGEVAVPIVKMGLLAAPIKRVVKKPAKKAVKKATKKVAKKKVAKKPAKKKSKK